MEDQILIVDDEEEVSSLIARRLMMEGYFCLTASTGKEAIHHLYKNQISLVICDILMPDMSGLSLLKNLRDIDPEAMVIMMTGYPDVDIVIKALRLGANDFLLKPFTLESLVFAVKNTLEKKSLREKLKMVTSVC